MRLRVTSNLGERHMRSQGNCAMLSTARILTAGSRTFRHQTFWDSRTNLRVQVPNIHIPTQNLYYNYYYPNPKYLIIGYLDPLGKSITSF